MSGKPSDMLPKPDHAEYDTMLAGKFGRETANYFSCSPLNRFSFLRTESPFLSAALRHPTTKFLLYNELAPLVKSRTDLYFASYKDVSPLVPQDLFDKSEEEEIKAFDSRVTKPLLVFLGLDESKRGDDGMGYKVYKGAPYFAVDVTPKGTIASQARDVIEAMKQRDLFFDTSRTPTSFPPDQAAIFAQGRHLIDWNDRYTFCGTCGSKLMSTQAGTKRVCPTRDAALIASGVSQDGATPECSSRARVSNVCFPRTDPTIIVAVLSHDGKRMLLGRQARWPEKWYSTLAGFVEPAESIEDAVRREVWEESGVRVARVVIHSSQPWPFPECLMIGAIAQVGRVEDETVHLEHDAELQDARWYPLAEVEEALRIGTGPLDAGPNPEYQGGLRLPGSIAIANRLMTAVVEGDFWKAKI